MTVDEKALGVILREFRALKSADRRAVERLLSPQERLAVSQMARGIGGLGRAVAGRDGSPSLKAYSPWLAKRLKLLLETDGQIRGATPTPETRKLLAEMLSKRSGA